KTSSSTRRDRQKSLMLTCAPVSARLGSCARRAAASAKDLPSSGAPSIRSEDTGRIARKAGGAAARASDQIGGCGAATPPPMGWDAELGVGADDLGCEGEGQAAWGKAALGDYLSESHRAPLRLMARAGTR